MWNLLRQKARDLARSAGVVMHEGPKVRRIAVCGLTSVGKSSFVNALLNENICAVRSDETTALPILVQHGEYKVCFIKRNGELIKFSGEFGQTIDYAENRAWSGFIYQLPRSYLKRDRYWLIDTPGIGQSIDKNVVFEVIRRCEVALVLFNKRDGNMLSVVEDLSNFPVLAVYTQVDDLEQDASEYDEERIPTLRELERRSGGFPIPFILSSTLKQGVRLGAVFVPTLSDRLDLVFEYRQVYITVRQTLDALSEKERELEALRSVLSADEAEIIYSAWHNVKERLDWVKKRRDPFLSAEDAEVLAAYIRKPAGRKLWNRVVAHFGHPKVEVGKAPVEQYKVLEDWFNKIHARRRTEAKIEGVRLLRQQVETEGRTVIALAASKLMRDLGDLRSSEVMLERYRQLGGDVSTLTGLIRHGQ